MLRYVLVGVLAACRPIFLCLSRTITGHGIDFCNTPHKISRNFRLHGTVALACFYFVQCYEISTLNSNDPCYQ